MWLLILTLIAAVIVVIVTGGSFRELGRMRFAGVWLLFAGLALQTVLEFIDLPRSQFETVGYGVLMVSYALVLGFCFSNLQTRGFGVISIGIALNALVIGLNQGMPTVPIGNDAAGNRVRKVIEQTVKHRPQADDDLLPFLDDRIILPEPFDEVFSFGDLIMSVGICELAYFGTRRRRRPRGTGQARVSTRASSTRSRAPTTRPS
ncbi:MAG: DUF5317 family protein [Acidimicrobiia bacterium]